MNWYVHGTTNYEVGFGQDGGDCEGGHCEHLKPGDKAHGYSGEADTWGKEMNLLCKPCYEKFLKERETEPTECDDCCREVPRNEGNVYMPYDSESCHADRMNSQKFICKTCQALPKHQQRLARDKERLEADKAWMDDDDSRFVDDEPDFDPDDDMPLFDGDDDDHDLDGGTNP